MRIREFGSIQQETSSLFDIYLIRKADIRYIVVDYRLAQGLPLYGVYIAAGEPTTRLTSAQLDNFYALLIPSSASTTTAPSRSMTCPDCWRPLIVPRPPEPP